MTIDTEMQLCYTIKCNKIIQQHTKEKIAWIIL